MKATERQFQNILSRPLLTPVPGFTPPSHLPVLVDAISSCLSFGSANGESGNLCCCFSFPVAPCTLAKSTAMANPAVVRSAFVCLGNGVPNLGAIGGEGALWTTYHGILLVLVREERFHRRVVAQPNAMGERGGGGVEWWSERFGKAGKKSSSTPEEIMEEWAFSGGVHGFGTWVGMVGDDWRYDDLISAGRRMGHP